MLHNKERVQEDSGDRAMHSGSLCCNLSHLAQRWTEGREMGEAIPSPGKHGVIRIRGGGEGIGGLGDISAALCFPLPPPPLWPCLRALESLCCPVSSLAQQRPNNLAVKQHRRFPSLSKAPISHLSHLLGTGRLRRYCRFCSRDCKKASCTVFRLSLSDLLHYA